MLRVATRHERVATDSLRVEVASLRDSLRGAMDHANAAERERDALRDSVLRGAVVDRSRESR